MLELPKGLACLSPKRKKKLEGLCMEERKDASLNVCVIGIKGLNHVHKIGLNKLSGIAAAWGREITAHYSSGEEMALLLRCTEYGDLVTDPVAAFPDLSGSRKREIARWLAENRMDAADIAYTVGQSVIARECGFGANGQAEPAVGKGYSGLLHGPGGKRAPAEKLAGRNRVYL